MKDAATAAGDEEEGESVRTVDDKDKAVPEKSVHGKVNNGRVDDKREVHNVHVLRYSSSETFIT